jgi:hypothetical protein
MKRVAESLGAPKATIDMLHPVWPEASIRAAFVELIDARNQQERWETDNKDQLSNPARNQAWAELSDRATERAQDLDWMIKTNALVANGTLARSQALDEFDKNRRDYSQLSKYAQEGAKLAGLWKP